MKLALLKYKFPYVNQPSDLNDVYRVSPISNGHIITFKIRTTTTEKMKNTNIVHIICLCFVVRIYYKHWCKMEHLHESTLEPLLMTVILVEYLCSPYGTCTATNMLYFFGIIFGCIFIVEV